MEIAAAALTAIASGVSTAASAAGTAISAGASAVSSVASGAAGLAKGGSMFANILQGGMGLVGAMSAVREGDAKASALRAQAEDARFDARTEEINTINRQASLRRDLAQALGKRDVAYAASGVDLSFGTPDVARDQALDDANRALTGEQADADMRAGRLRERATQYRRMADDARTAGRTKALLSIGEAGLGMARRG